MPHGSARQSSERKRNGELEPFLVEQIQGSPIMRGRIHNSEEEPFPVENIQRSPVMRGRRQNSEEEPFPVENIPRSPVMRGRRQNPGERFVVEDIPRSPVMRGRGQNSEEERFSVKEIPGSPVVRGRVTRPVGWARSANTNEVTAPLLTESTNVPGWNLSNDTTDNPIRSTMGTASSSISVTIPRNSEPPDNDDAPPSYESSIPPNNIGWAPNVTSTVPFPMPHALDQHDGRLPNTFSYPPINPYPSSDAYPTIELSPLVKSYISIDTSKSRSPVRSISPSPSPSPDRLLRPAYSYQQVAAVRTPTRPLFRRVPEDENQHYSNKQQQNEFSYKYGAIIIAAFFVTFMMILSLVVKFLIRNSFNK